MMTRKAVLYWSTFMCIAVCMAEARASELSLRRNINTFIQYADVHFVELDNQGEALNEEKGPLLFSGFGLYWQLESGIFTELFYKTAGDDLTYRGLSQLGQFTETKAEYFVRDTQITLGRNFGLTSTYLGLGKRFRERNILRRDSIIGLYEEMDITYGLFGLSFNLFANQPFQLKLTGSIATDLDSKLYVASEAFDPVNLDPGKHLIVSGAIELTFHLFAGFTLGLVPGYEYVHINKSDLYRVYVNGIYTYDGVHPESEYETLSLKAKLSWNF